MIEQGWLSGFESTGSKILPRPPNDAMATCGNGGEMLLLTHYSRVPGEYYAEWERKYQNCAGRVSTEAAVAASNCPASITHSEKLRIVSLGRPSHHTATDSPAHY